MLDRFGKTLVILVTELDSGRERQLTPQSDPDLPVRVAVRMSMGIPGICEPFRYENHVYCDGGMCNDFPLNALPEGSTKLGLMVRPKVRPKPARILISQADPQPSPAKLGPCCALVHAPRRWQTWVLYNLGDLARETETISDEVRQMQATMHERGIYPVRDAPDLMMTSIQTMMDANLALQIRMAQEKSNQARRNDPTDG